MKLMVQVTKLQLSPSWNPDRWVWPQCGCHSTSTHASQPHVQSVGTVTVAVVPKIVSGSSPLAALHSWYWAASSVVL